MAKKIARQNHSRSDNFSLQMLVKVNTGGVQEEVTH